MSPTFHSLLAPVRSSQASLLAERYSSRPFLGCGAVVASCAGKEHRLLEHVSVGPLFSSLIDRSRT